MQQQSISNTSSHSPTAGKNTLVLGASLKPERHSNMAVKMLREHDHPVVAIGGRDGQVEDVSIYKDPAQADTSSVHTVTLYMGAVRQADWHEFILGLHPQRIIFNPGAENRPLLEAAQNQGIEALEACTLVMLSIGRY